MSDLAIKNFLRTVTGYVENIKHNVNNENTGNETPLIKDVEAGAFSNFKL